LFVKIFYQGKILRFQNVTMRCAVTPVIFACIWNKVEYLAKEASYQNSIKEIILSDILSDIYNAIINIWGEISCHRHFKSSIYNVYNLLQSRSIAILCDGGKSFHEGLFSRSVVWISRTAVWTAYSDEDILGKIWGKFNHIPSMMK
jgi:hypothetical protein